MSFPHVSLSTLDYDPRIRKFTVLFLRMALGICLLNNGTMEYMLIKMGGRSLSVYSLMPHAEIIIGLALIFGLFTTYATLASGVFLLIKPLVTTAQLLSGGGGFGGGPWAMQAITEGATTNHILLNALVLWFSQPGLNPWSLDQMLFGHRDRIAGSSASNPTEAVAVTPISPSPEPAPPPGKRTSKFLSSIAPPSVETETPQNSQPE